MAVEDQSHDASSGDTAVDQNHEEKPPVEAPPAPEADKPAQPEGDAVEKDASGAPLDRTISQQKMGKKKIAVVMAALCVREHLSSKFDAMGTKAQS